MSASHDDATAAAAAAPALGVGQPTFVEIMRARTVARKLALDQEAEAKEAAKKQAKVVAQDAQKAALYDPERVFKLEVPIQPLKTNRRDVLAFFIKAESIKGHLGQSQQEVEAGWEPTEYAWQKDHVAQHGIELISVEQVNDNFVLMAMLSMARQNEYNSGKRRSLNMMAYLTNTVAYQEYKADSGPRYRVEIADTSLEQYGAQMKQALDATQSKCDKQCAALLVGHIPARV
jgi:hypothetical protein